MYILHHFFLSVFIDKTYSNFSDKAAKAEFKVVVTTETLGNITSGRPAPPQNRRRPRTSQRVNTQRTDLFEIKVDAIQEDDEDESSKPTTSHSSRTPNIPIGGGPRKIVGPSSTDANAEEPKSPVGIRKGGKLLGAGPMGGMPRGAMPMGGMPMGGMPMGGMPMGGVPMGGSLRGGASMRGPRMPGGMGNPMMAEMLNKRQSMRVAPTTNDSIEEAIKVRKSKSIEAEKKSEAGNASKTDDEPEKEKDEKKHKGFMSGLSNVFGRKKKDKN